MAVSTLTVDEATNESTGRGLLARRGINEGDQLLGIPLDLCMTKSTAFEYLNEGKNGNPLLKDSSGRGPISPATNEYIAIACFLIYEKYVRGPDSFWKPYLDVLPTTSEVGCTFTWDDSDLSYLTGSPVMSATTSMKIKLQKEYEAFVTHPVDGVKNRFKEVMGGEDVFTYEQWTWAFTMLFSRAIRLQNLQEVSEVERG